MAVRVIKGTAQACLLGGFQEKGFEATDPARCLEEIVSDFCSDNQRYVFVRRNGFDFASAEIGKIEAILETEHAGSPVV
jgi:hypothetical protein